MMLHFEFSSTQYPSLHIVHEPSTPFGLKFSHFIQLGSEQANTVILKSEERLRELKEDLQAIEKFLTN